MRISHSQQQSYILEYSLCSPLSTNGKEFSGTNIIQEEVCILRSCVDVVACGIF